MEMDELERIVKADLAKICIESEMEKEKGTIFFSKSLGNHSPGNYIYVDKEWVYFVSIGDRGKIEECIKSQNIEEVLYEVYWSITARLSTEYAKVNRLKGKDWRRIMFSKRLELLRLIGVLS